MVEAAHVEEEQGKLTPDGMVELWEGVLRNGLNEGIGLSESFGQTDLNVHLKAVLTALDGGNFEVLEEYRSPLGALHGEIREYARPLGEYMKALDKRELLLNKDGVSAGAVVGQLTADKLKEFRLCGYREHVEPYYIPHSKQEGELLGAMAALGTALVRVDKTNYPVAELKKMQQEAKERALKFAETFADGGIPVVGVGVAGEIDLVGEELVLGEINRMCDKESGAINVLEEALEILKGGEVAQVQAHFFKVITQLLGFIKTGEQNVLLVSREGWKDDRAVDAEMDDHVRRSPISTVNVLDHQEKIGTRAEVLNWAEGILVEAYRLKELDAVVRAL
ncbi:MAG: hypothetical protein WCT53_01655 [Candidatus Gracilibacteria bacterium]